MVWTFISDNYLQLLTANILIGYFFATFCYIRSFSVEDGDVQGRLLAPGGITGNMLYDWFIGRELNPSIGSLDVKSFNEIRPGLMAWVLVDIAMACEQAVRRGGKITDSMWLVVLFQSWYVVDSLINEVCVALWPRAQHKEYS